MVKCFAYSLTDDDPDPMPRYTPDSINQHGTRVAGTAAAASNNVCGVGVAYEAGIGGIRMLDGDLTDAIEVPSSLISNHRSDAACRAPR